MTKLTTSLLVCVGLWAIGGNAQAQLPAQTVLEPSVRIERVPFTATDLANERGIRNLKSRVYAAVDRVCSEHGEAMKHAWVCRLPTLSQAYTQIGAAVKSYRSATSLATAIVIAAPRGCSTAHSC